MTLFVANEEDVRTPHLFSADALADLESALNNYPNTKSIPVRKTPLPEIWDQYLLYGIQRQKRTFGEMSKQSQEEPRTSFLSLCLSEEERQTNNYMVVKSKGRRNYECVIPRTSCATGEGGLPVHRALHRRMQGRVAGRRVKLFA